jgi:putative ABC transport system permease protein
VIADYRNAVRVSPPSVDVGPDGTIRPRVVAPSVARQGVELTNTGNPPPTYLYDTPARTLGPAFGKGITTANEDTVLNSVASIVGRFDPAKLAGFSSLSSVPLETYQAPALPGADARSRGLLGNRPLDPNGNPASYLSSPPMLLTSLNAVSYMGLKAPISAVRVRLTGNLGVDPVSRERVRVAAQRIHDLTGLAVDITVGSSPSPQTVDLPAGQFGRPALALAEPWTRKGVAVAIIAAIDRKSIVLFGLILVVCLLFLVNAVSAAVRDRRRELALLAVLGWPPRRLAALIGIEVATIGLVAGAISAALAGPVASLTGVHLGATHALLAIPVGVGLAILAALAPALLGRRQPVSTLLAEE